MSFFSVRCVQASVSGADLDLRAVWPPSRSLYVQVFRRSAQQDFPQDGKPHHLMVISAPIEPARCRLQKTPLDETVVQAYGSTVTVAISFRMSMTTRDER
jgi:hypothetical protein